MRKLFSLILLSCLPYSSLSVIWSDPSFIPTNTWAVAGVPGGIPNGGTVYTNMGLWSGVDTNGVTSMSSKLTTLISDCPAGQVIVLPAGRLKLTSPLAWNKNIVLRGAGMSNTWMIFTNISTTAPIIDVGASLDSSKFRPPTALSSAMQGSSNIVMAAANTNINVGSKVVLDETNEPWIAPTGSDANTTSVGYNNGQMGKYSGQTNRLRLHWAIVTGKTTPTNLTIHPPMPFTFDTNYSPQISSITATTITNGGIEDVSMDFNGVAFQSNAGKGNPLRLQGLHGFWLKNVEITKWKNHAAVWALQSSCVEMRGCYIHTPTYYGIDHGYGLLLESTSGGLFIDNIHTACESTIIAQNGVAGCVFAYNVYAFGWYAQTNRSDPENGFWLLHEISGNHTPFPAYNLYEGNYTGAFQSDYYYGPSGFNTLFRNRIPGRSIPTTQRFIAVSIDAKQRYYSIVGNSLGTTNAEPTPITFNLEGGVTRAFANPNILTWTYEGAGTDVFDPDSAPHIYRLGYPMSGGQGTAPNVNAVHDTFVKTNTLRHGNWDAATSTNGGVRWDPTIADTNLPSSLFLASAPSFFGAGFNWPPYGPSSSISMKNDLEKLPAGWRLVNGTNKATGELVVSTNSIDFGIGYISRSQEWEPLKLTNTIWLTNIGTGSLTITQPKITQNTAPTTLQIIWPHDLTLSPGETTNVSFYFFPNDGFGFPPYISRKVFAFTNGNSITVSLRGNVTFSNAASILSAPSEAPKEFDFVISQGLVATSDTVPFIPGQSGEAYLYFDLTNRSIVRFTASVLATNTANSFAMEVDGEPSYPYSVWDVTTNAGFTTQTVNLRGGGTSTAPDLPAKPWFLETGTHYVKMYGMTKGTAISNMVAVITPIIPQTTAEGSVTFEGGGGLQ